MDPALYAKLLALVVLGLAVAVIRSWGTTAFLRQMAPSATSFQT